MTRLTGRRSRVLAGSMAMLAAVGWLIALPASALGPVAAPADRLATALDDLAARTEVVASTLSDVGPASPRLAASAASLANPITAVREGADAVQAELAANHIEPSALATTLRPAAERLVAAVGLLGQASEPAAADQVPVADALAPAISALADALQTLAPALQTLAPVFAPLAPAITPACGEVPGVVLLALGLGPFVSPVPLPDVGVSPTVVAGSLLAPAFLVCASLPAPPPEAGPEPSQDEPAIEPDSTAAVPPSADSGGTTAALGVATPVAEPDRAESFLQQALLEQPAAPVARSTAPAAPSRRARSIAAAPLAEVPFLPIDRSSEATSIAVLLVLMAGAVAATSTASRRWPAIGGWEPAGAVGAGLGALVAAILGWNGAAGQVTPWAQVPYLVSGGLVAVVLGLVALTLGLARPLSRLARR